MGSTTILPVSVTSENGVSRSVVGAVDLLTAMSDGSDSSYVVNTSSSMKPGWGARFAMADVVASLPAGAVIDNVQLEFRYSRAPNPANGIREIILPVRVLVGKPVGSSHSWYNFGTPTEPVPAFADNQVAVAFHRLPPRAVCVDGTWIPWHHVTKPGMRIYVDVATSRRFAWNSARLHSVSLLVNWNEPPTVSVSAPTGSLTTSRPPATWSVSDNDGDTQVIRQVRAWPQSVYSATGFDPDNLIYSPPSYTDDAWSAAQSHTPTRAVGAANGNYRMGVRVFQRSLGPVQMYSPWAFTDFALNVEGPAAPTLNATFDAASNAVALTAAVSENALDYDRSSFETSVTGWTGGTLTSVARSNAVAASHGSWSMRLTRNTTTGPATAYVTAPGSTLGYPVKENAQYTAMASFRAGTTSRTCTVSVGFYTAAGVIIAGTQTGTGVADSTGGWTQAHVTFIAPATAAWARITVSVASAVATEVHYVDKVGLQPGSSTTWKRGGFVHSGATWEVERSFDGGATWEDLARLDAFDSGSQVLAHLDVEARSATNHQYRARLNTTNQDNDPVSSDWSATQAVAVPAFDSFWLYDVTAGESMRCHVGQADPETPIPSAVAYPLGQDGAVVSHDGTKSDTLSTTIDLLDEADWLKFRAMLDRGNVLLLKDVLPLSYWVQAVDVSYERLHAQATAFEVTPVRHAHRATVKWVGVARPDA